MEGSCFYLRRTFNLTTIPEGQICIKAMVDDHMTAYINGHELQRMEDIIYDEEKGLCYDLHIVPQSVLKTGENILAIFANDEGSGEAYLDYGMMYGDRYPGIIVAKTVEGAELTYTIINEAKKTCRVGTGTYYSADATISSSYRGHITSRQKWRAMP